MAQEEHATTPRALWVLLVAGPAIVAIEQQLNFVLVRQACSMQRNIALYVVTIVALLLTIANPMPSSCMRDAISKSGPDGSRTPDG